MDKRVESSKDEQEFYKDLEMLKYFQDEYKFRHAHFWGLAIKLLIMETIILFLPITSSVLGIELKEIRQKEALLFPIFGVFIAILTFKILHKEAKNINAVGTVKYRINKEMDKKYHYHMNVSF